MVGVTLQLYDHGEAVHRAGSCCAGQDIHDARRVAETLGIPHYVLDYESRFRDEVIDRFVDSYLAGETPVPCIECNRQIKFRDLLDTARDLGAAALATGHYIASRALPGGRPRTLPRRRRRSRPELFPLRDDARAALAAALPAGRDAQERGARAGARARPVGRRQARQPGHLLRAHRALHRRDREAEARGRVAGRDRASGRPRARPARRRDALHGGPAQRPRHRLRRAALRRAASTATPGKWSSARARRWRRTRSGCARSTGSATANWTASAPTAWRSRFACAPPALRRRPRSGLSDGEAEIELAEGEYGVSPGQACVFYDSIDPRARVLGGGVIRPAAALRIETPVRAAALSQG